MTNLPAGGEWSALRSAAVLMTLTGRADGAPLTGDQRDRILFELRKYVPCYCEAPAETLLAAAEPVVQQFLARAPDPDAFGAELLRHGSRLLVARDRETLRWALGAAIRIRALGSTPTIDLSRTLHHVWRSAQGQMGVDSGDGNVELGQQDMMRAKNPAMLEALLQPGNLGDTIQRISFLGRFHRFSDGWTRQHAFAFLIAGAYLLDDQNDPAGLAAVVSAAARVVPLDRPPSPVEINAVRAYLPLCHPRDRFVFFCHFEDQLMMFVDLPKNAQNDVFHAVNGVVAKLGEPTAGRRELVTLTMALLAQGASAQWTLRPLPPQCVWPRPTHLG